MRDEFPSDDWFASNEDAGETTPPTEPKGELTPPPRKPPTAVAGDASEPEPRPPHSVQRWNRPTSRPRLPRDLVHAVDAVLDVLDSIGDAVRTGVRRIAG